MRRLVARLWQREFARRLSRVTGHGMSRADIKAAIARLPHADMPGRDRASRFNRLMARSLHAAADNLERDHGMSRDAAVRAAGEAFVATGSWLARAATRLWLRLERDPFAGIERRGALALPRAMWGEGMGLEERRRPGEVSLCVTACPFHAYFQNAGRSDLTPILCAWDTAWTREVNASSRPLVIEVRQTLAAGGAICEFAFLDGR